MDNELDLNILKTLLTNRKYALEFVHESNEKLFVADLWRFAKEVIDYIKVYHNVPTRRVLLERVKSRKSDALYKSISDILDKLDTVVYDDKDYQHDLEKIKTRFSEKLISNLKDNLTNANTIDVKKSVNEMNAVISNINSINKVKAYEQNSLKDSLEDFKNRYQAKMKDPEFGAGIPIGMPAFDYATSGLRNSEMLLVGGITGGGKSLLLMNIAINMFLNNNNINMDKDFREGNDVLYFSLEMPHCDMIERMLSRIALVPQKDIRDAKLNERDQKQLIKAMSFIKKYPYNFEVVDVPRGASIQTIDLVFADVANRKRKPKIVVVDYLTLMDYEGPEKEMDDWLKQGKISEQLSEFARMNEIILLSACQLNDPKLQSGGAENQIGLHRIGRSRQISHNANFFLQIEARKEEQNLPDMNVFMIKSRRSELCKIKLYKNFACCALLNDQVDPYKTDEDPDDISDKLVSFEEANDEDN